MLYNCLTSYCVRPILMYCYQQQLGLPKGTIDKLQSIHNRAAKIANPREPPQCWDKVAAVRNRRATMDIFKCLNGLSPDQFKQCFKRHQHGKDTRGSNSSLVLPRIRTETGKRMFAFQGDQIFNKISKDIREVESPVRFKQKLSFSTDCNETVLNAVFNLDVTFDLLFHPVSFNRSITDNRISILNKQTCINITYYYYCYAYFLSYIRCYF